MDRVAPSTRGAVEGKVEERAGTSGEQRRDGDDNISVCAAIVVGLILHRPVSVNSVTQLQ